MFKKLVPVVCLLAFAAGPVFAADTTAPSSDSSASAPAKSTHAKKHHKSSKKSKTGGADASAPK
jgi:Ni/Co efflux regulator RcnB